MSLSKLWDGLNESFDCLSSHFHSLSPNTQKFVITSAGLVTAYFATHCVKDYLHKQRLHEIVEKRQTERNESLRRADEFSRKITEARRNQISNMDFDTLLAALKSGEVKPTEALHTYQWKALQAHKRTNCITLFIKEADDWALQLEKSPPEPRPPLYGMPMSLKECVPVKGYDVTRGYVNECFMPSERDCVMVEQIKALGGIPFVQTNVPQCLLAYSCYNPIYGTTNHQDHKDRTSGGSSGGESALIGAGGSLLGIGGDVGGSIRFPCHFCGIAGIKPSHIRFSHRGVQGSVPGRPLINASDGPMAPDVHTCVEFLKATWSSHFIHERDPYTAPVTWNDKHFTKGNHFTIGYYLDDGWFTPTPALQRAVLESKKILESQGHVLVPFKPPRIKEAIAMFIGAVSVDGGRYLLEHIGNDLMDPRYKSLLGLYKLPFFIQDILRFLVQPIYPRLAHALTAMPRNTSELRKKYEAIEQYRYEYIEEMQKLGLDAILCPVTVTPAPHHEVPVKLFAVVSYTGVFNLLDFAAGTVPVTQVTKADDDALAGYPTIDPWYRLAKETTKGAIGLSVGVQVAAPPFREEVVLRIMQDLENHHKHTDY
ncbi:unnamed protein product, partial [Mesorhabditis belari]|uniref:fatty acid amide hydrolase n=1 Tax=Mesorhabditis belari TaxID=2138241 RepID=A0AAF3EZ27_9BILA